PVTCCVAEQRSGASNEARLGALLRRRDAAGERSHERVRVFVRKDERWADLQDVVVAAGTADQDSLLAQLVHDALGLFTGGELNAREQAAASDFRVELRELIG